MGDHFVYTPREIPLVTVNITVCSECGEVLDDPHTTATCPKLKSDESVPPPPPDAPFVVTGPEISDGRKLKPLTQVGPKQNGDLQEFEEEQKK